MLLSARGTSARLLIIISMRGVVRGEGQVSREDLRDMNFEHCLSQYS
jgi:hypothetical protein